MQKPPKSEALVVQDDRLDTQKLTKNGYENQGLKRNRLDADLVRERARGRWKDIFSQMGIDQSFLTGKHVPCPICGGVDRFRFDDKNGSGSFFCNVCGPGDGFKLVANLLGLNTGPKFPMVVAAVAEMIGIEADDNQRKYKPRKSRPLPKDKPIINIKATEQIEKIWSETLPLTNEQALPAKLYIINRGLAGVLEDLPENARMHPNLPYYHDGKFVGFYPALIFQVHSPDGQVVTLHRIYLDADGLKANVPGAVKKLMTPIYPGSLKGSSIRLYQPISGILAFAEGPETSLAVRSATGLAVWATISASLMPSVAIPQAIKNVQIWADKDHSGAGQKAAETLAKRLVSEGVEVRVMVPPGVILKGEKSVDWLDILNTKEVAA